ncbi:hypothetical protein DVH05_028617 [Phytophthora capsici]|nr:hypothetical protein DVH05_028617 [Phytophthora capsici]
MSPGHVRVNVSRVHRHDHNVALFQLKSEGPSDHIESGLGSAVTVEGVLEHGRRLGRERSDAADNGRQLNHRRGAMVLRSKLQVGEQSSRREEWADRVHLELTRKSVLGTGGEVCWDCNSGVVDEQVNGHTFQLTSGLDNSRFIARVQGDDLERIKRFKLQ